MSKTIEKNNSAAMVDYFESREEILRNRIGDQGLSVSYLMDLFVNYTNPESIMRFLGRYELYKMASGLQGSIVECGVYSGSGIMSWAVLASLIDPSDISKQIYGFDTFTGFPEVNNKDLRFNGKYPELGELADSFYDDLLSCIKLYHLYFRQDVGMRAKRVALIKGNFMQTGKTFLSEYPHVLISILYLDFDLYEPTKLALDLFLPRMLKGGIVCFDELNHPAWPGETLALLEGLNLQSCKIKKLPICPKTSYFVI